jgi:hypothetical protein
MRVEPNGRVNAEECSDDPCRPQARGQTVPVTFSNPTIETRNLDLLEGTYRRTMPIVGLVRSYLVASTLTGTIGLLITVASGGQGLHRAFMLYVGVLGFLFVTTALIQRLSRWIGVLLLTLAALGLVLVAIFSVIGVLVHLEPVPTAPRPGTPPSPAPQRSGLFVESTIGVVVVVTFLIGVLRCGWLLARVDGFIRRICADQLSKSIIGRPAVLSSFGIPGSILNAGQKRTGIVSLFWLSAALFALAIFIFILLGIVLITLAARVWTGYIPRFFLVAWLVLLVAGALLTWASALLRRSARSRLRMSNVAKRAGPRQRAGGATSRAIVARQHGGASCFCQGLIYPTRNQSRLETHN